MDMKEERHALDGSPILESCSCHTCKVCNRFWLLTNMAVACHLPLAFRPTAWLYEQLSA